MVMGTFHYNLYGQNRSDRETVNMVQKPEMTIKKEKWGFDPHLFQFLFLSSLRPSRMIFCSTEAIIFFVLTTVSGLRET